MKNIYFILILLGAFVLASCSSVPKPITRDFTTQETLEASEHWEIVAQDFANQIVATMVANPLWILNDSTSEDPIDNDFNSSDTAIEMSGELPSIFLPTKDLSAFGKTFRSYLITEITKLGYPVAHTSEGAVIARWSVNKIYHKAERTASAGPGVGTLTALLGSGVYKIIDSSGSIFAGVVAAGAAYDAMNASGGYIFPKDVPHTEIVLTFTVSKDSLVLSRESQAYYVNAKDFDHYNNIVDFAGQESELKTVKLSVTN